MIKKYSAIYLVFFLLLIGCKNSDLEITEIVELNYPENLEIIKRSDWGWLPIDTLTHTHQIKYITVHHGGVEFTEDMDPLISVQQLQIWSRNEKKWIDIPYHFMIDLQGNIFEARPINIPGDTNTEYDPTEHALIEMMGNYEIQVPNESQIESLISLSKFLMNRFEVPLKRVKTHKDYSELTVCPGKNLYEYFKNGYIENALINEKYNQ